MLLHASLALATLAGSRPDWLVDPSPYIAASTETKAALVLDNGLVAREFLLAPDVATVRIHDRRTRAAWLRAVEPEASVVLDGREFAVGGLLGQRDRAYLKEDVLAGLQRDPSAFHCVRHVLARTAAPFEWKRARHAEDRPWPPPGVAARFDYAVGDDAPAELALLRGVAIEVHYELYDGLPLFAKWLVITNGTARDVVLDAFTCERLALVEAESTVSDVDQLRKPAVDVFSDLAMNGMDMDSSRRTTSWVADRAYDTQVNYSLTAPLIVESRPPLGPAAVVAPGKSFTTFRTYALFHDSTERERQGLGVRKALRALAPWCTENPLMLHVTSSDDAVVKRAIDQAAECGFEMVIQSFGSGLDMEDVRPENLARHAALVDYAHAKGIELGGYSLLASRSIAPDVDVIDQATGKPGHAIFGSSPCLSTAWGAAYFERVRTFLERTGFDLLEHDGSYPGDDCASTAHAGHRGHADSLWNQWSAIRDFYRWCRARGTYLNVPDFYFLAGSNKTGMGYRETNWSLPRDEQLLHARQHLFDGTWTKTPSMGWMFVPLTQYHGGGAAATIEPLSEHLDAYEGHLANTLLFGAQACWRGPRLHDAEATKALVVKWVELFRRHRAILESDVLHLRRADGIGLDYVLHVNPKLPEKALLAVFNPSASPAHEVIVVPLHYAGLDGKATVRERDGAPRELVLDGEEQVELPVAVLPRSATWFVFE